MINSSLAKMRAYQLAFEMAMNAFYISKLFPKEELYSLTDQLRRSARSVVANIAEAYRSKMHPKNFVHKLSIADAELTETMVWIEFAFKCAYVSQTNYEKLTSQCAEVGRVLGGILKNPSRFVA